MMRITPEYCGDKRRSSVAGDEILVPTLAVTHSLCLKRGMVVMGRDGHHSCAFRLLIENDSVLHITRQHGILTCIDNVSQLTYGGTTPTTSTPAFHLAGYCRIPNNLFNQFLPQQGGRGGGRTKGSSHRFRVLRTRTRYNTTT